MTDRVECLEELAMLAFLAADPSVAQRALDKILSAGCSEEVDCVRNIVWVGIFEEGRGNDRKAMTLFKRALERTPDDDALLERVAGLAARSGLHAEAAEDYTRLAGRHPTRQDLVNAAAIERERAMKSAFHP